MKIENYDNRFAALRDELKSEGRHPWFIAGALDGAAGTWDRRPERASLQYRIVSDRLEVLGKTFAYREALRKLGGRWNPSAKAWVFPRSRLDELLSSADLRDGWHGMQEAEQLAALAHYGPGYTYGPERALSRPIGRVQFPGR